jgi:hypothetical protein
VGEAFPYLAASDEAVRAGAWTADLGGGQGGLPEWIADWELSRRLDVRRRIEVDPEVLRRDTGLDEKARFNFAVTFESAFDDAAVVVPFGAAGETASVEVAAQLDGSLLAGSVALTTTLVLAERGRVNGDPPIAHRRASVLWRDTAKIRLHGDASQFPLTVVDFAALGLPPGAPWFVEFAGELESPAMGAIRLMVNEANTTVVEAIKHLEDGATDLSGIRSALFADVGRTLVEHALARPDLNDEWPEDSLGLALRAVLSRFKEAPSELRAQRDHDPQGWASRMSATFGLMREPLT